MTAWWFYHLERATVSEALPPLLEKCLERDWRVLISSPQAKRLADLDEALWTYQTGSFLPHGRDDGSGDASRQPILLSTATASLNGAQAVVLLDGQELGDPGAIERCMVMFDGADTVSRDIARAQFKAARDAGRDVKYFQQAQGGGWVQKA